MLLFVCKLLIYLHDFLTIYHEVSLNFHEYCICVSSGINGRRASLFCGLRKYTKSTIYQRSGQHKEARSNLYLPFHLTLSSRDFRDRATEQQHKAMFLVVTAQPVHSAYKGSTIEDRRGEPTDKKIRWNPISFNAKRSEDLRRNWPFDLFTRRSSVMKMDEIESFR